MRPGEVQNESWRDRAFSLTRHSREPRNPAHCSTRVLALSVVRQPRGALGPVLSLATAIMRGMHEDSRSNGYSRWYLCDLQVHTVADQNHSYGDYGSREPSRQFAEDLIRVNAKSGVSVMAVTDLNRVDWYPVLRKAEEEQGVWLLPGTEVSVNGCHLLAIWDRTDEGFQLTQDFLKRLWKPGTKPFLANGDPRPVSKGQIEEIGARAKDYAPATIRKAYQLVSTTFDTAVTSDLIARSPCRGINLPKAAREEMRFLSPEEIEKLDRKSVV